MSTNPRLGGKYFCQKCGSFQEFVITTGMTRAGDRGYCESVVWHCKNCGFSPFLPPKKEENNESSSN